MRPDGWATCCIAGCGPAGAMLGLLLARAGVEVVVLEKHSDFLRDFRGDTIHPSTMELMAEIGLAERVLGLRHSKARQLVLETSRERAVVADFSRLRTPYPYVTFLPQWDFLNLLTAEAKRLPAFRLLMDAPAEQLIVEDGVVRGLRYAPGGQQEVRALLTVAADGRDSRMRAQAGLEPAGVSPPMDVLWFRLSRRPEEPETVGLRIGAGHILILINRFEYWQAGYVVPKGTADQVRARGLAAFKRSLVELVPPLADRVEELEDWEQVKLLSVQSNRLGRWHRPGLLCIGDAAHAMSPIGGVGINLAIQDAVEAANVLAGPLRAGRVESGHLEHVQRRRQWPTRVIQALQHALQRRLVAPVLADGDIALPRLLGLLRQAPLLQRVPAYLIGFGVRRVHVQAPVRG